MLIFDLDGTLIDSRADLTAAVNAMRAANGLAAWPLEQVVPCIGNGMANLVDRTLADAPQIDRAESKTRLARHYALHPVDSTVLYPGVGETLQKLYAQGIPLAVVTNKPETLARRILELLGVMEYFAVLVGGDGPLPLKPAPDALNYCLERTGSAAEASWMVGDHYTDLEAGRRAGMRRAYALWGFGDPRAEEPERRLADFTEVATLNCREELS